MCAKFQRADVTEVMETYMHIITKYNIPSNHSENLHQIELENPLSVTEVIKEVIKDSQKERFILLTVTFDSLVRPAIF